MVYWCGDMKIAIDISQIIYGTGVSQYTQKLVENLLVIDKKNEYILFGYSFRRISELKKKVDLLDNGIYKRKLFPIPPIVVQLLWNKLNVLPVEKLVGDLNIYHSSDWTQYPS